MTDPPDLYDIPGRPNTRTTDSRLIASDLDYDLPFIPVVTVISPICVGMCVLLSRFANWTARRQRRNPRTEAVESAPAQPGTLLPTGPPTPARA